MFVSFFGYLENVISDTPITEIIDFRFWNVVRKVIKKTPKPCFTTPLTKNTKRIAKSCQKASKNDAKSMKNGTEAMLKNSFQKQHKNYGKSSSPDSQVGTMFPPRVPPKKGPDSR